MGQGEPGLNPDEANRKPREKPPVTPANFHREPLLNDQKTWQAINSSTKEHDNKDLPKLTIVPETAKVEEVEKVEKVGKSAETKESKLLAPLGSIENPQVKQLVKELGPNSTPADFKKAADALKKLDGAEARAWQQWATVGEHVVGISGAAKDNDRYAVQRHIDALINEAKLNNPHGRMALAGLAIGNSGAGTIGKWLSEFPAVDGKPLLIANLARLSYPEDVTRKATGALDELAREKPLSPAEFKAVALALANNPPESLNLERDKLTRILLNGFRGTTTKEERASAIETVFSIIDSRTPGSEKLTPLLLRECDLSTMTKHLPQLTSLARQNDKAGVQILAEVAAGKYDRMEAAEKKPDGKSLTDGIYVPLAERAKKVLEEVGERPGLRPFVVSELLESYKKARLENHSREDHGLGSIIGNLANGLNADKDANLLAQVRDHMRSRVRNYDGMFNEHDDRGRSAMDGLIAMSKHLKKEDIDVLLQHPCRELAQAFATRADSMPKETRQYIISSLENSLKTPGHPAGYADEVRCLASFAKELTKDQISFIASFGGDGQHNRGGKGGSELIKELGVKHKEVEQDIQGACGELLLHVLSRGANAERGKSGPREAAYAAFRDLPWPLPDGKGGFQPSHESSPLKTALLDYYSGRQYDTRLAGEINRIVDSANLPKPAADILHGLGIGDAKNPRDPETRRIADRIINNYDRAGVESGVEVLRRVLSNAQMLNSPAMPAQERARLMGWTQLSEPEKAALGWMKEPPPRLKESLKWDQMTEEQKESIRWSAAKVDTKPVAGQMFNHALERSANAALLKDQTPQLEAMRQGRMKQVEQLSDELATLHERKRSADGKSGVQADLERSTKEGVSFGRQVGNLVTFNGRRGNFEQTQERQLDEIKEINSKIAATEKRLEQADQKQHALAVALQVGDYHQRLNVGDQTGADQLAVKMWKEHGPALSQLHRACGKT